MSGGDLVTLGHLAVDGTKIKSNANKHIAMSYGRMSETEQRLRQEVEELRRKAAANDEDEDALYGEGGNGEELPAELARREDPLKKIREAGAALEREAKEEADVKIDERREKGAQTAKKAGRYDPKVADPEQGKPEPKAQRNFKDPEGRITPDAVNKGRFIHASNAQEAVDSQTQATMAAEVTRQSNGSQQVLPMSKKMVSNASSAPTAVSAVAGYRSEANASDESVTGVDLYIATGRQNHGERVAAPTGSPPEDATPKGNDGAHTAGRGRQLDLRNREGDRGTGLWGIKERRGFRRFSFSGMSNVSLEWKLICLTGNLLNGADAASGPKGRFRRTFRERPTVRLRRWGLDLAR